MRRAATLAIMAMFVVAVYAGAAFAGGKKKDKTRTVISESGEMRSCDDLHVFYDDDEVVRAEENFTFVAASGTVNFNNATNGGIRVQGYDGNEFQVRVCKTAREDESILQKITVERNGNTVSVNGPRDEDDWNVQLLVLAPRTSAISARTTNGPLSALDLTGSFAANAVNGPIDLRNVSGTIDAQAKNGPISLRRGSGTVKLAAVNGPIDVSLAGREWTTGSLDASTRNGPISVQIPDGFASGVEVRTAGHSPIRCKVKGCSLTQDEDGDFRVLRFGDSSDVRVRASTDNGPVEIETYAGNFD